MEIKEPVGSAEFAAIDVPKDPFADAFDNPNTPTRLYPRMLASGNQTGRQTLGSADVYVDAASNRIVISNQDTDTTFNIGVVQATDEGSGDANIGLSIVDGDDFTLFTLNGQTWYWYDKATSKNVMQVGKLPDDTYGWAIAKSNQDVEDGF